MHILIYLCIVLLSACSYVCAVLLYQITQVLLLRVSQSCAEAAERIGAPLRQKDFVRLQSLDKLRVYHHLLAEDRGQLAESPRVPLGHPALQHVGRWVSTDSAVKKKSDCDQPWDVTLHTH